MIDEKNFRYFCLKGLLGRKIWKVVEGDMVRNPEAEERHDRQSIAIAAAQMEFFLKNDLFREPEKFRNVDIVEVEIWWDDFTEIGKAFVRNQIDKWLRALDRQNDKDPNAMASVEKLQKRYDKFTMQYVM